MAERRDTYKSFRVAGFRPLERSVPRMRRAGTTSEYTQYARWRAECQNCVQVTGYGWRRVLNRKVDTMSAWWNYECAVRRRMLLLRRRGVQVRLLTRAPQMWGFPVLLFFDYLRCVRRADGEWRWNSKTSSSATNIHHLHMPCLTMVGSPLYCGVWKHCHNTLQYLIQWRTRYSTYLRESIKEPVLCLESVATSRVILTPRTTHH